MVESVEMSIREFLLYLLEAGETDIVRKAAETYKVSRQAVYKHINSLVDEGVISKLGKGRGTSYILERRSATAELSLNDELAEDIIWSDRFSDVVEGLPENLQDICHYVFTEMVNNAIEHSDGDILDVTMVRNAEHVIFDIRDDGEGIFKKIQRSFNLIHEEQALFELSKGKLTTDPSNHSGEGIFFSSRLMDDFFILSGGKQFSHSSESIHDWFEPVDNTPDGGTRVLCGIDVNSTRTLEGIFDQYAMPDEYSFARTKIPMKLAEYDDQKLISRSQAKRVLARVEKFKFVEFDFKNVESIGQGFADEIFRVYARKNPDIALSAVNANENVLNMVKRAQLNAQH